MLLLIQYRSLTWEQSAGPVQSLFFLPCLEQGVSAVAVSPQHETNFSFTLKMVLVLFSSPPETAYALHIK